MTTKYDPLREWLSAGRDRTEVTLGFADIEAMISAVLPASAHRHRAWWANDPTHVHARAWLDAGWTVGAVDQRGRRVRLRRAHR